MCSRVGVALSWFWQWAHDLFFTDEFVFILAVRMKR
jgi:hypothetical protein